MAGTLIRCDISLPNYFSYEPAPAVDTRPMIPRREQRGLFMRGEFGTKPDGRMRPVGAHNTTHLDVPFHFLEQGADMAQVLNRADTPGDRFSLARVLWLAGRPELPGVYTRDGVTYCEAISTDVLPSVDVLAGYESLVVLTGFGAVMAKTPSGAFATDADGRYHLPYLTADAVRRVLQAGLRLVALDSNTVEAQSSVEPIRFTSDAHYQLLGHAPPVLIVEGLGGGTLEAQVGFAPHEALLQIVPRRVNAAGAEAMHSRAFLYFYRDDAQGTRLRALHALVQPGELYG
ncbi:MAG: cyclase family protein [Candidatus Lambdaproteobacteria bacterium]|nr:cyclase family protein [Candidatus Lambdaproteobacteria bacterium]